MKSACVVLALAAGLTACTDDNDSNPTLLTPTEFVLNTPTYANQTVDLSAMGTNGSLPFTWSQPVFTTGNAPVVAKYRLQVSTTGKFTKEYDTEATEQTEGVDYYTVEEDITTCSGSYTSQGIMQAIESLNGWEEETQLPDSAMNIAVRLRASVDNASSEAQSQVVSNAVNLSIYPKFFALPSADPVVWYLVGDCIGDGKWSSDLGSSAIPIYQKDGEKYNKKGLGVLEWTGYLVAGKGFKIVKTLDENMWKTQWGMKDDGSYTMDNGGNITVATSGYYTITLDTKKSKLSITEYKETPAVYGSINLSGDFNSWGDEPMNPCNTVAGVENHDWYLVKQLTDGGLKFKQNGSWDYNSGCEKPTTTSDKSLVYGIGTNNGSNISISAGKYLIIYNDITRAFRFVIQK